jgi:hypothetical protein
VRSALRSLSREAPILPVSARTGRGVRELSIASIKAAKGAEPCILQAGTVEYSC